MARLTGFLSSQSPSRSLSCYQLVQGKDALGSGGLFGVGSGASRAKWGWVPNSPTDFIFAILGEELGLVGTLCVRGALRRARVRRAADRPAGAGHVLPAGRGRDHRLDRWLQALVNMGAVLGLLPITGVPLPLISAGVSSLIATLAALGMLLSFARPNRGRRRRSQRPGSARGAARGWLGLGRRPP